MNYIAKNIFLQCNQIKVRKSQKIYELELLSQIADHNLLHVSNQNELILKHEVMSQGRKKSKFFLKKKFYEVEKLNINSKPIYYK